MLKVEQLHFRDGGTDILRDVSVKAGDREILSLLGPSGSGKTTLLRCIAGLAVPQQGQVSFGEDLYASHGKNTVSPADRPFSFLFQDFTLFPHLTVRQNILLGIRKLPKSEQKIRLNALTDMLGIGDLLKRSIHRLSGGEQQRVALARTLALKPKVLLLDEPFSNLDPMTKSQLSRDVKHIIREENMTAILATHDREEAFYFSDRLIVMSEGQVKAAAPPHELYLNPKTAWMARFTGEAQLLGPEELQTLGAPAVPGELFCIRPEDLVVENGGCATIKTVEYYGQLTRLSVAMDLGTDLTVICLGVTPYTAGDRVSVRITRTPIPIQP
jgi:iron(III) transport system ATP-binding protein